MSFKMAVAAGLMRALGTMAPEKGVLMTLPVGPMRRARGSKMGTRREERSPARMASGGRLPMLEAAAVRWRVPW